MLELLPWALRPLPRLPCSCQQFRLLTPSWPLRSCRVQAEVLAPPWRWAVTLTRRCTPCGPDTRLVLFSALSVNWEHRWTERRVWKEV